MAYTDSSELSFLILTPLNMGETLFPLLKTHTGLISVMMYQKCFFFSKFWLFFKMTSLYPLCFHKHCRTGMNTSDSLSVFISQLFTYQAFLDTLPCVPKACSQCDALIPRVGFLCQVADKGARYSWLDQQGFHFLVHDKSSLQSINSQVLWADKNRSDPQLQLVLHCWIHTYV